MEGALNRILKKELEKFDTKPLKILDKQYTLYIVPELCDEDLNIFEGFLFVEADNKSEVSYLKTRYKPPVSGYAPRIGIILYNGHLLLKDYRKNKHIIKTFKKINKTFLNKLKKALSDPKEKNLSKLFDRSDVIEEFYILYKKARDYLLKNVTGIPEEEKREEFVDNFMMQMLTLWYLQERGFFNNDKNYFITKFKELKQKKLFNGFKNYYEFLVYLFEKISGYEDKQYIEDSKIGKVVVIGPAVFLNGEHSKAISIPDKCFYKEGMTDILINTPPKKVNQEVPLLNLFESRDWTEGNIDEFVLGAIYEKLITYMERKKLGAYYTPEEITSYICKNTIAPYLVDRVNERFNEKFESIDQIIESNDTEILLCLFEQLKEIKILDPAVGSAHFLESAINVLVEIYEKIREKAKELNIRKGFEIKVSDEKGEIKTINLLEISDDEKFKLFVKFFIILSKNIYGVDINPSALKVAKARLFLSLAKHFRVGKEEDIFIRFPNVHFNLRNGNSLIGYIKIEKEKHKEQVQLKLFIKEAQAEYISEKIKVVSELKPYLEKTANALGIDGKTVNEVEDLNRVLSKKQISWDDFEKVLRTKEKLIRILIASLNSQYAVPLNDLLREITDLFNHKLDEKFAKEHNIKVDDLKKIKTFHWIFEFPEAFLDRSGFDVVVGNPPYVGEKGNKEKFEYIKILNPVIWEGRSNMAYFFVMRALDLIRNFGYMSMIIPRYWITADYSKKMRKAVFIHNTLIEVIDFEDINPFPGKPGVNFSIIFVLKNSPKYHDEVITFYYPKTKKKLSLRYADVILVDNKLKIPNEILNYIEDNSKMLVDLEFEVHQGIITGADRESKSSSSKGIFVLQETVDKEILNEIFKSKESSMLKRWFKNSEIKRYHLKLNPQKSYLLYVNKRVDESYFPVIIGHLSKYKNRLENRREFKNGKREWYLLHRGRDENIFVSPKIVVPQRSKLNAFVFVNFPFYASADVYFITSKRNNPTTLKLLLLTLNSKLMLYYLKNEGKLKGGQLELYFTPLKKLPIRMLDVNVRLLSDYLLFLNATEDRRQKFKNTIEFFDRQIADFLIYELYFKEKFHKDGLYPEPKEYLLEAVSKHLKPISYDRWAELYWKKQIEENLTKEEQKELEKLEKENIKTVEGVYKTLKEDVKVKELIEKIKSHEWVKLIEGEG